MIQKQLWEITDEFWEEVKNLIPEKQRDSNKENINELLVQEESQWNQEKY
ncbi:hypothetical protein [Clostridium sp.]